MIVDGFDLKTIGLVPHRRGASRSSPRFDQQFVQVPGAWKALWLGRGGVAEKVMSLTGHMVGSDVADLRGKLDELKWRLRPGGSHTLRWSDDATREWVVRFSEMIVRGIDPEWIAVAGYAAVVVEVACEAEDPRAQNPTEQNVNSAGALPRVLTPTAMGNAPMPVLITITGNGAANITNLTIEYRDSGDTVLSTFTWDGADLTGSDTLTIDTGLAVVERNGTNDIASVTDTSGVLPFDMDPNDGDFVAQTLPDIRVSGTGTADVCRLTYRERYW